MKIVNTLWIEKYRPSTLDDIILPNDVKEEFTHSMKSKNIPNLLFSGPPGGGKTTIARIIASKKGLIHNREDNVLEVNGSAKETRGINFVQDTLEPFLKFPPAGDDKYKIVFIDEGDNLTEASFKSLRGIIEKYQVKYGRFIVTCNYLSKIPEPVQSRFTIYKFKQLPIDYVNDYCKNILVKENIEFEDGDLDFVIKGIYPDIRRIIGCLQRFSSTGKLKVNRESVLTVEKTLIGIIIEIIRLVKDKLEHKIGARMSQIINILNKEDVEYRSIYETLFFSPEVPVYAKMVINKYANGHQGCLVPNMHFIDMVFGIVTSGKTYRDSVK